MGHAPEHERKTAGVSRTYRVTYQRASWETPSVAEASGQEARLAPTRYADAGAMPKPLNSETEVLRQIVPNEKPRYWAGLEVGGFPSGTSTSFLKKVRMRSRCEAAMS